MQGLSVKAVAQLSGVSAHTLRAWEKRHAVVGPLRQNGRRVYSLADVDKLRLLGSLSEQGHSIGHLAKMSCDELRALALEKSRLPGSGSPSHAHVNLIPPRLSLVALLKALETLDLDALDREVLKARMNVPVRSFVLDVVAPLLAEVGRLVCLSELDIAQEHALSAILRTHLGELLAQVQRTASWSSVESAVLPRLLFSTPEGDLHEFGILLGAILAGTRGFKCRYLGPNMPAGSLAKAAASVGAKIIVLGSVPANATWMPQPMGEFVRLLAASLSQLNRSNVSIWIGGGSDFDVMREPSACPLQQAVSLQDFDDQLEALATASEMHGTTEGAMLREKVR